MRMMEEGFGEAVTPLLGKALAPVVLHFGFNTRATEKKQPSHCFDLLVLLEGTLLRRDTELSLYTSLLLFA